MSGSGSASSPTVFCGPPWRARLAGLAPLVVLGIAYAITYRLLGCGVEGSGIYVDPVRDTGRFLATAAVRIPMLLAGGIAGFSADWLTLKPEVGPALIVTGWAAALALGVLLRACWRLLDEPVRRRLRWLLTGSVLGLLPAAAAPPSDRMLFVPAIGLMAALAAVLIQAWRAWQARRKQRRSGRSRHRLLVGAGVLLGLIHLILAPLYGVAIQSALITQSRASLETAASSALAGVENDSVIVLPGADHVISLYLPLIYAHREGVFPGDWRTLSLAPHDHWLRRPRPRSLELEVVDGVMMRSLFEELYRDRRHPLPAGTVLDRRLLRVEILEDEQGAPTRIAFEFDRDLDDPSLRFLIWREGRLQRAVLPAVGGETYIERELGPAGF
jgi:hypothetical protein